MLRTAAAAIVLLSVPGFGQSRPAFEVATIKLNKSGRRGMTITPRPGGRFIGNNCPFESVIAFAYQLKNFQLAEEPGWLTSERYDIEAKAPGDAALTAMLPMIQTLLEDRLQLRFHRETKEEPVYALAVAKSGKLQEAGECTQQPGSTSPPPKPGQPPPPGCGSIAVLRGRIVAQHIPIARLVDALSNASGRMVLDKTNLGGKYDIDLQYAPDLTDSESPSLFTALQEQLGLKLESQKGPVEMFVIEHVERPSEN